MTIQKELHRARMLKHSLELSLEHLSKKKLDTKELKKKLTTAKSKVTALQKKVQNASK